MITVLTGKPGNGKTSLLVMRYIKKAIEEGRPVITIGIPKLTLPVIEWRRTQLKNWHHVSLPKGITLDEFQKNDGEVFDEEGNLIPVPLMNTPEGALIIVDEAQKTWPASGTKYTDDQIQLSMHRHWGLDFVICSQSPKFLNLAIVENASKHIHLHKDWRGGKLYEYGEVETNPTSKSVAEFAYIEKYAPDPKSFQLYESASLHTKLKYNIPKKAIFFGLVILVGLPFSAYKTYDVFQSRTNPEHKSHESQTSTQKNEVKTKAAELKINTPQVIKPIHGQRLSGYLAYKNNYIAQVKDDNGNTYYANNISKLIDDRGQLAAITTNNKKIRQPVYAELPSTSKPTSGTYTNQVR